MATPQILRIPRSDSEADFVLVRVARRVKSPGLDLRLYATEGETVFKGSVRASQVDRLRAKNNHSSDEEWTAILSYAFCKTSDIADNSLFKGLELTASVSSSDDDDDDDNDVDKALSITLRKKIGGISQKLGTVQLLQSEDEISLFDWCETAVSSTTSLQDELGKLQERAASVEDVSRRLKQQLNELIQAKADHDRQLVAKFAQLLNEKKLKIRNQQRLLSSLNVDPDQMKEVDVTAPVKMEEEEYPESPKVQPRSSKRKNRDESPGDRDFDRMYVDVKQTDPDTESDDDRQTPQPLEEDDVETASEDEL